MTQQEAQLEELQALQAIYPNEIHVLNEQYPDISLSIELQCSDQKTSDIRVSLMLHLPADYPEQVPEMELRGLHSTRVDWVLGQLKSLAMDNVGMPMVFTIVCALQEHLDTMQEQLNNEKVLQAERHKQEAEAVARKKFEGTRVTVEAFEVWKHTFDAERNTTNTTHNLPSSGLTGRELFLRDATLNLSDVALLNDPLNIDESLFDEDLDELESDEDY